MASRISIVKPAAITIAKAIKGLASGSLMVIGTGNAAWDILAPIPQPPLSQVALLNQIGSVTPSCDYLNSSGSVVTGPTPILRFTGVFDVGAANGSLREIGLIIDGRMYGIANIVKIDKPSGVGDFPLARQITIRF